MKILVFGATGAVGSRVVAEALARGHQVGAVVRTTTRIEALPEVVTTWIADASDSEAVARLSAGHDLIIGATRPAPGHEAEAVAVTRSLLSGCARTNVRLLVVGGAGSLTVPGHPDRLAVDDPALVPPAWRDIAQACVDQLAACRERADVDWTSVSPPALLEPGARTGRYRTGTDELLLGADGRSWISLEDLAVAMLDEAERPRFRRTRFTVAS